MHARLFALFSLVLLVTLAVSGCGPGQLLGPTITPSPTTTLTPTLTPTPTSTPTLTPTATPTNTPTLTPTAASTPTQMPLPAGWQEYQVGGFSIALPAHWETADADGNGSRRLLGVIEDVYADDPPAVRNSYKFWAVATIPAEFANTILTITETSLSSSFDPEGFCDLLTDVYHSPGVDLDVTAIDCNLLGDGLNTVRMAVTSQDGGRSVRQYHYHYVQGHTMWRLTLSADASLWTTYEPTFATIGRSFRVSPTDTPLTDTGASSP